MTQTKTSSVASTNDGRAILRAAGLRKTFRMGDADVVVLKHVDLTVRRGEFLAIEGRSGSGKSTLMHVLAGLDAPNAGTVEFLDQNIGKLAVEAQREQRILRTFEKIVFHIPWALITLPYFLKADRKLAAVRNLHFGFVFQFYHLLPELNVLENTLLAPMIEYSSLGFRSRKKELQSRATDLLDQFGLAHRLKHRPNQLSGGERQRVAIARALMNSPKVLFADEPTGNLDAETGRQIMNVLEKLHQEKGQTIVMVTHDRSLAREADRVLLLEDGRLKGETVD